MIHSGNVLKLDFAISCTTRTPHGACVWRSERTRIGRHSPMLVVTWSLGRPPESRRHAHNVSERKRRNDLKNSLLDLQAELPALAGKTGRVP